MPRRKNSKSLKAICIENIASNFERLWCKSYDDQFAEMPRILYVIGPMELLTGELTELLMQELQRRKLLKAKHFPVLLHEQVQKLNLQCVCNLYKQDDIVQMLPWRCQRLTHLCMDNLNKVSVSTLRGLVERLPQLQSLSLESTKCADEVLHTICISCRDLASLNVQHCQGVTDRGVKFLCENPLPNLRRINLMNTKITFRGSVEVVTKYPNLSELITENSIKVFYEAFHKLNSNANLTHNAPEPRKVKSLRYSHGAYMDQNDDTLTHEAIELVCKFCPQVSHVELYAISNNSNILAFQHLKHLCKLEIVSQHLYDDFQIDFKGLCNLLSIIGRQISDIIVCGIAIYSLEAIGNLCPNLRVLDISDCYDFEVLDKDLVPENRDAFRKLQLFSLRDNSPAGKFSFHEQSFHLLLERAELLKKLELWHVCTLTNETITNAVTKHSFTKLRSVVLHQCHVIEGHAINSLLQAENDLRELHMHGCKMIYKRDYQKFVKYCRSENLNIAIDWT